MQDAYFADLYGASDDPYQLRSRWYEERKRTLLLAALPQRHYLHAYEPGCGIGELTVALSKRCDEVLSADFSERAVEIASARTRGLRNVRIEQHTLPDDWPHDAGPFDLIVLSELGYFLDASAMRHLAGCCRHSLAPQGTLVACDWRPDFKERVLATDAVQSLLSAIGLPRIVHHEEEDFILQVWSGDGRSVAQREGIR
ncbi:class I SAM-dependent methyltransferase [Variovorax sp. GT1P44]|uniref:class I SAM-dependent methyltransferase n=1 Tax=Variovorax sp. GT1P44 TaxID=3443742 RepID=UPI003F46AB7B